MDPYSPIGNLTPNSVDSGTSANETRERMDAGGSNRKSALIVVIAVLAAIIAVAVFLIIRSGRDKDEPDRGASAACAASAIDASVPDPLFETVDI